MERKDQETKLYLRDGTPVFAASTRDDLRLGPLLVRQGKDVCDGAWAPEHGHVQFVRVFRNYPLDELRGYIDWQPFFIAWELKTPAPMVPMRFFRAPAFASGNAVSLLFNAMNTAHRFRLWRIDDARVKLEDELSRLFGEEAQLVAIVVLFFQRFLLDLVLVREQEDHRRQNENDGDGDEDADIGTAEAGRCVRSALRFHGAHCISLPAASAYIF